MRRGRTVREFREKMLKGKSNVNPARSKRLRGMQQSREEQRKKRLKDLISRGIVKEAGSDEKVKSIRSPRIHSSYYSNTTESKINWKFLKGYDDYQYKGKHINVCHVIESLGLGGGQTMMFELFHGLEKYYGKETTNFVVALIDKKNFIAAKELVKSYNIKPIQVPKSKLRKFCEENKIDVVVHHRISVSNCLKKLIPMDTKYILINHTWHRINKIAQFGACDFYVSVCKFLYKRTRWPRHINSTRKGVILNGVENDYLSQIEPADLEGKFITGRCHRMVGGKFHADSIRWMDKTFKKSNGYRHYILGTSKSAKNNCSKSKICNYMGSVGNRQKKMSIIKAFSLYFYETFQHEGASIAILESLAAGVPVICKDFGGNKEMIANGVNGYIVNNREGFAQIIKKMMANPDKLERLQETTRKNFYDRLHIRHTACQYMQLFEASIK